MQKLLNIEWLKLKHYTAFKVISLFFVVGIFLTNYIVFSFNKNVIEANDTMKAVASFSPYSFYNTWQTTSYASGFLLIIPALLLIIITTNEYGYKTSRQNIIDGLSRHEFILTKLVMALIVAVITTILVFICALLFGLLSGTDFSSNQISHVGFFFLKALTYNLFAILISVLVKKTGFAIGLCFIYIGAENIISQLLDFGSMKLKSEGGPDLGAMGDYLPMNAADGLLTFPKSNLTSMAKSALPEDYTWVVFAFAIAYLILFFWWSRKRFIKADL